MPKAGIQYQHAAAAFFRSVGLSAEVEAKVDGARGKHKIDVWVTGKLQGFNVQWIIECKDWNRNIPKEKVEALQTIVQDVGADRAWLFSEKGFQSGAIHMAQKTNMTLCSLKEIREGSMPYIVETQLHSLFFRVDVIQYKLEQAIARVWTRLDKKNGSWFENAQYSMANLTQLMRAIRQGLRGDYPVACTSSSIDPDQFTLVAGTNESLLEVTGLVIDGLERQAQWAIEEIAAEVQELDESDQSKKRTRKRK